MISKIWQDIHIRSYQILIMCDGLFVNIIRAFLLSSNRWKIAILDANVIEADDIF